MDHHLALSGRFAPKPPNINHRCATGAVADGAAGNGDAVAVGAGVAARGFYTLLDNDEYYRHRPEQLGGGWLNPDARDATLRELVLELEPVAARLAEWPVVVARALGRRCAI